MPNSNSLKNKTQKNPRKTGMIVSLVGAVLILLSVPLKWEESYVTGLGESGGMSIYGGCVIVIPAILILGLVISELASVNKKPTTQVAIIGLLCLITFLFALSSLFGVMMVGSSHYGEVTAGVKTGLGLWLAIFGTLICAAGQGLAVGYDPPLLPSQPKQTEAQNSSRCAKCGADLMDSDIYTQRCSTCGADWSSSNAPPPIPNSSRAINPSPDILPHSSNVQTGFQPTQLPNHMPPATRRKRSSRSTIGERVVVGCLVVGTVLLGGVVLRHRNQISQTPATSDQRLKQRNEQQVAEEEQQQDRLFREQEREKHIKWKVQSEAHTLKNDYFGYGTKERDAVAKQLTDWRKRRTAFLNDASKTQKDWKDISIPTEEAVASAIANGKPIPVTATE